MARNRNRNRNRTKERMPARKARPFTVDLSEPELTPAPLPALAPAVTAEPEKKDNPLTREQQIKAVLMALDGYSNAAAFLGDDCLRDVPALRADFQYGTADGDLPGKLAGEEDH